MTENNIPILDTPGNYADLDPIANLWAARFLLMKIYFPLLNLPIWPKYFCLDI